jgi:hypothetical protein
MQTLQNSMNNTGAIYEPNVEILNVTALTNGSGNSNHQTGNNPGPAKMSKTMILNSPYGVS